MQVRVVGVYDGVSYRAYKSVADFIANELVASNHGRWFYAHAGGVADYQFLHERFVTDSRFSVTGCSSGSSAMIVDVMKGRHKWRFVDSYRLLPDSLAKIGKSRGTYKTGPTEDMDEEARREWYASVPLSELIPYNEQDCKILWHAIDEFEDELLQLGGQLQMTLAGCSLELFRRKYLKSELPRNVTINEWSRKAYVASRVEVYQRRATDCHYWDINSSFPASMTLPLPGKIKSLTSGRLPSSGIYLADVEIEVPDCALPPLPYRASNRIFFPTGKWRSYFFWVDIQTLLEAGGKINKVHDVVTFDTFEDCGPFAMDLYSRRQQSEGFRKYLYKILLNSLYGKFAESTQKEKWHVRPNAKTLDRLARKASDGSPDRSLMYMPGVWREPITVRLDHEHVALSAAITAWSRRALFLYMQNRDCFYCDTDGFAIPSQYKLDRVGSGLGDLKLEKIVKAADFVAPKVYRLEMSDGSKLHKAKGFSLKQAHTRDPETKKLLSIDEATAFERILEGREIELIRMLRLKESMAKRQIGPSEHEVTKRLKFIFPKRCFASDGKSRPWTVEEICQHLKLRTT